MRSGFGVKAFLFILALLLGVLIYAWFGDSVRYQVVSLSEELAGADATGTAGSQPEQQRPTDLPDFEPAADDEPLPQPVVEPAPDSVIIPPDIADIEPAAGAAAPHMLDEYRVVLGADEHLQIPGLPGELRVWIGSPEFNPAIPEHMVQDETNIPALGESARVQPFAPAFDIAPAESQCIKIHPSGSEVRFRLIAKTSGVFEVGADVFLFESPDCSGAPIPKTSATLMVEVKVNRKGLLLDKAKQLGNVVWEQFLEFWGAFIALLFGLILFLIRGKLKRWFGFEDK